MCAFDAEHPCRNIHATPVSAGHGLSEQDERCDDRCPRATGRWKGLLCGRRHVRCVCRACDSWPKARSFGFGVRDTLVHRTMKCSLRRIGPACRNAVRRTSFALLHACLASWMCAFRSMINRRVNSSRERTARLLKWWVDELYLPLYLCTHPPVRPPISIFVHSSIRSSTHYSAAPWYQYPAHSCIYMPAQMHQWSHRPSTSHISHSRCYITLVRSWLRPGTYTSKFTLINSLHERSITTRNLISWECVWLALHVLLS